MPGSGVGPGRGSDRSRLSCRVADRFEPLAGGIHVRGTCRQVAFPDRNENVRRGQQRPGPTNPHVADLPLSDLPTRRAMLDLEQAING